MLNKMDTTRAEKIKGFTLLEVIIAIVLLTVGLMGTAAAITYAL